MTSLKAELGRTVHSEFLRDSATGLSRHRLRLGLPGAETLPRHGDKLITSQRAQFFVSSLPFTPNSHGGIGPQPGAAAGILEATNSTGDSLSLIVPKPPALPPRDAQFSDFFRSHIQVANLTQRVILLRAHGDPQHFAVWLSHSPRQHPHIRGRGTRSPSERGGYFLSPVGVLESQSENGGALCSICRRCRLYIPSIYLRQLWHFRANPTQVRVSHFFSQIVRLIDIFLLIWD